MKEDAYSTSMLHIINCLQKNIVELQKKQHILLFLRQFIIEMKKSVNDMIDIDLSQPFEIVSISGNQISKIGQIVQTYSILISMILKQNESYFNHLMFQLRSFSTFFLIMEKLLSFRTKEVLLTNETQKILYILGTIEGGEGEAIVIITPKLNDPNALQFKNVKTSFINDIYYRFNSDLLSSVEVQMIYPITEKHKNKYRRKELSIHFQSGEEYASKAEELLKKQLTHIQWVNNIIEGKSEVQRVLFRNDDFLIVPDFKYTDLKETQKLHLMALFSHPKLHSLRDLTGQHLPLLQNVRKEINRVLKQKFGLDLTNVRMYFHYPPTFYRLHIHIMHLSLEALSCRVERSHDLNLVIQNIRMKSSYYQEVTLNTFVEKQA